MKKRILNTDDNDAINPIAGVRNAAGGADYKDSVEATGTAVATETEEDEKGQDNDDVLKDDKPYPGEIAFPGEQENSDEMA